MDRAGSKETRGPRRLGSGLGTDLWAPAAIRAEHRHDIADDGVGVFQGFPARQDQLVDFFLNHENLALGAATFYHRLVDFLEIRTPIPRDSDSDTSTLY